LIRNFGSASRFTKRREAYTYGITSIIRIPLSTNYLSLNSLIRIYEQQQGLDRPSGLRSPLPCWYLQPCLHLSSPPPSSATTLQRANSRRRGAACSKKDHPYVGPSCTGIDIHDHSNRGRIGIVSIHYHPPLYFRVLLTSIQMTI
jgi:hypothetical protein